MIKLKYDENEGEFGKLKVIEGQIEFNKLYAEKIRDTFSVDSLVYSEHPSGEDEVDFYDTKNNYCDDPASFDNKTLYRVKIVEV